MLHSCYILCFVLFLFAFRIPELPGQLCCAGPATVGRHREAKGREVFGWFSGLFWCMLSFQTRLFLRFGGARLGSSVGDFVWLAGPQLEILHGQSMKKTSDCSTTDLLSGWLGSVYTMYDIYFINYYAFYIWILSFRFFCLEKRYNFTRPNSADAFKFNFFQMSMLSFFAGRSA